MKKYLIILTAAFILTSRLVMADDIPMTQVIIEEVEPGLDPSTTRILMNKRYMLLINSKIM